jgi:hypothetical protein
MNKCGVGLFKLEGKTEQIMKKTTITTLGTDQNVHNVDTALTCTKPVM